MVTKRHAVPVASVTFDSGFWHSRREINRTATLPTIHHQLQITGRFDAWKLDWTPGQPDIPHIFWDSDGAKWIEACAYSLATHPDEDLEEQVDAVIDLIAAAQQPDGYLNIYYTAVEPEKRWSNLRERHELYCAGHLIEAAVAYYQATGKRKLLDVLCRYADHIDTMFGPNQGQKRGYPGHEEIELALVKLYQATGEERYLKLSKFFIDERGQQPHYYDIEAEERGDPWENYWAGTHRYTQSHIPVREQTEPVGHAVRAGYLYAGMADIALATDDESLTSALRTIWNTLTGKQMYITGGIGPSHLNEGFSFDYDLPNDTAYAETCAAIALVFWAQRMFHLEGDSRYVDVLERALFNGVLSGVGIEGEGFFYANPLEASPQVHPYDPRITLKDPQYRYYRRSEWFDCACCPPNLARLVASLGSYCYTLAADTVYLNLFGQSRAEVVLGGEKVQIVQETNYPWEGTVAITVTPDKASRFTLAVRVPGWCEDYQIRINGEAVDPALQQGYARLEREWQPGDRVELTLTMPVQRVRAHPRVRQNAGCVALQRGPVVYCLEQADNGAGLAHVTLPHDSALSTTFEPELLDGVTVITGQALRVLPDDGQDRLYDAVKQGIQSETLTFKAIPYCFWANREPGEMRVWIREG